MIKKAVAFLKKAIGLEVKNAQLFRGAIENCEWLRDKSFAPGGWAMDNAALYTLFCILNHVKPKNILEFGLGQSSKMVHQYAAFFENVKALTVEHNPNWISSFYNGILEDIKANIKQLDMEKVQFNGFKTLTYKNINEIMRGDGYDLIIVDGPFGSKHYSRSQIIDFVKNGMPEQFRIFIDDTERKGEKDTVKIICETLGDKGVKYFKKEYIGEEKDHTIIFSDDLKFLASLK
jgi:hypothetical protein